MHIKRILVSCVALAIAVAGTAQTSLPLVFDKENTGTEGRNTPLPSMEELPAIATLPDPFRWLDGSGRSTAYAYWEDHRQEIMQSIFHYETGRKPTVEPTAVKAHVERDTLVADITVGGETLRLTAYIHYPKNCGEGLLPAVIGVENPYGSLPADIFTERGIAGIAYNFKQVMNHTQKRGQEPINRLYPDQTAMGAYAAWPWGVSRLIDALEQVGAASRIDTKRLAVTGCSFAGKMALFSGALDERIALTIAQEPGGGGVNAWRVSETLGNVERIHNTSYAWFKEEMRQFANGNVQRLPHDHHALAALVAPRALLVIGNTDYEWLAEESNYVSCQAVRKVYRTLGIEDRMGFSIIGGHPHCQLPESQYADVAAFVDRFLLGKDTDTRIYKATMFNAVDYKKWMEW